MLEDISVKVGIDVEMMLIISLGRDSGRDGFRVIREVDGSPCQFCRALAL